MAAAGIVELTDSVLRQAVEVALRGGTPEHPYAQGLWGSSECGTACCVWGHACLIAGVEPAQPGVTARAASTPYAQRIVRLAYCVSPDILRVMQAVQPDGSIDLRGADLRGADLSGAVLSGAVLRGAVLSDAVLSDAVLSGAVLSGAVLRGAVLRGAVLRGAVLRGAVLSGAVLRGADLSDAVLRDAVLRDAVLTGADLTGADLTGAVPGESR